MGAVFFCLFSEQTLITSTYYKRLLKVVKVAVKRIIPSAFLKISLAVFEGGRCECLPELRR